MSHPDENDRLRDGTLPTDAFEDAKPFSAERESGDSVHSVHSVHGKEWETPLPLGADHPELPSFPVDALPPVLGEFVLALAEHTQVPAEMPGCCVLGVVSASIAGTHVIEVWPGYREPTNTWHAPTALSGARKSAAIREATRPVKNAEMRAVARGAQRRSRMAAQAKVASKRLEEVLKKLTKAPDDESLQSELASLIHECERHHVPAPPRYFTTNATPEAIPPLLAAQDGRLLVVSAEGGELIAIAAGLYSRGRDNYDVLLKGWSGDDMVIDRKGAEPIRVEDPCLSMILMFQPSVLQTLGGHKSFRGRGFLGRFLFCNCEDLVGQRRPETHPIPTEVRSAYETVVEALFSIECEREFREGDGEWATGPRTTRVIGCEQAAHEVFKEYFRDMEAAQLPGGRLWLMRDWASKAHGQAGRIAAALHAATHAPVCFPSDVLLGRATAQAAVRIMRYFEEHARAAFSLMSASTEVVQALAVLRYIRRERINSITRRDLYRAMRGEFGKSDEMSPPLTLLEDRGYLRAIHPEREPGQPGRSASPTILVNPFVLDSLDTLDRTEVGGES